MNSYSHKVISAAAVAVSARGLRLMGGNTLPQEEVAAGTTLAQTEGEIFRELMLAQQDRNIQHTCQSTHTMNKGSQQNFSEILNGSTKFVDSTFPASDALYWYDMGRESNGDMSGFDGELEWKRVSEVFDDSYSLWGTNGITPHDIAQGSIGNCWYLAAAAALAEYPDRLDRVVENANFNEAGIYAFHFYALGVPYTQIIDDLLPLQEDRWRGGYRTVFGHVSEDKALWGPLMEKAFAKLHGNYEHIIGGIMSLGVSALNGSPFRDLYHNRDIQKEELWTKLRMHDAEQDIVTAGTLPPGGSCYATHPTGLQYCHAYSTMHTYVIPSTQERVLLIRNPWARNNYNGQWRFNNSAKWTNEAKQVCNYDSVTQDGGFFFMSYDEYWQGFSLTSVNYDTSDMHQDYFLMFNDPSTRTGRGRYCSHDNCTSHTLTVTNEHSQEQNVHIGAHIWQDRGYSRDDSCSDALGWGQYIHHEMWLTEDQNSLQYFDSGSEDAWFDPIRLGPGETRELNILFDWTRTNITKDWSATAWGELGDVKVTHNDNIPTTHMPKSGLAGDEPLPTPAPPTPTPPQPTPEPTPNPPEPTPTPPEPTPEPTPVPPRPTPVPPTPPTPPEPTPGPTPGPTPPPNDCNVDFGEKSAEFDEWVENQDTSGSGGDDFNPFPDRDDFDPFPDGDDWSPFPDRDDFDPFPDGDDWNPFPDGRGLPDWFTLAQAEAEAESEFTITGGSSSNSSPYIINGSSISGGSSIFDDISGGSSIFDDITGGSSIFDDITTGGSSSSSSSSTTIINGGGSSSSSTTIINGGSGGGSSIINTGGISFGGLCTPQTRIVFDGDGYKVLIYHSCDQNMNLKVTMDADDWASKMTHSSTGIEDLVLGCQEVAGGDYEVTFFLTPQDNKFGLNFDDTASLNIGVSMEILSY